MKKENRFHKKAVCERILRVWEKMPDLTLAEIICKSNDLNRLEILSDETFVDNCAKHIKVYKEENSLKNKIKKGLKTCVTKLTLW
jgi:hypothetical protein